MKRWITRDPGALPRKAALVLGGAALGYAAFTGAVAGVTRGGNANLALRVAPGDPEALAARADLALTTPGEAGIVAAERFARRSVAGNLINPQAIRALGIVADVRGDEVKAARLMTLAARLSRRDTAAQFWLIEDKVAKNDLAGVLEHYDAILRTNRRSWKLLFPVVEAALAEPEVRSAFTKYIVASPPWLERFFARSALNSADPSRLSDSILLAGGLPADSRYRSVEETLLQRLAVTGRFAALDRYFRSLASAEPGIMRSASFGKAETNPRFRPISWTFTEAPTIAASLGVAGGGRRLSAFAGTGAKGIAARKLLFLAPGRYLFTSRQKTVRPSTGAAISWVLQCLGAPERTAWTGPDLVQTPQVQAALNLDGDCPAYALELRLAGGSDQDGFLIEIDDVALKRVSASSPETRAES